MLGREEEGQQQALRQKQERPEWNLHGDEDAADHREPAVNGQAQEARAVRQRGQLSPLGGRQARDHAAVVVLRCGGDVHGGASPRHSARACSRDQ
jgi:hypothetical protein